MFAAYDVSLELIRALRPVIAVLRKYDRELAGQLQRAATSALLNVAEGRDRRDGDQRRNYETAAGSSGEAHAALEAVEAWGWPVDTTKALTIVRRQRAILYGLVHGPRASRA